MQASQGAIELSLSYEVVQDIEQFTKFVANFSNSKKIMIGLPRSLMYLAQPLMKSLMSEGIMPITYINNNDESIKIRML